MVVYTSKFSTLYTASTPCRHIRYTVLYIHTRSNITFTNLYGPMIPFCNMVQCCRSDTTCQSTCTLYSTHTHTFVCTYNMATPYCMQQNKMCSTPCTVRIYVLPIHTVHDNSVLLMTRITYTYMSNVCILCIHIISTVTVHTYNMYDVCPYNTYLIL